MIVECAPAYCKWWNNKYKKVEKTNTPKKFYPKIEKESISLMQEEMNDIKML